MIAFVAVGIPLGTGLAHLLLPFIATTTALNANSEAHGIIGGVRLDFIVPGFSKCGTTTLCSLLSDHPAIFMPKRKDFRFFDLPDPASRWAEFTARFEDSAPGAVRGDGSIWYSDARYERLARERILARYPDIRLIFIARDPIARIESSFREFHHSGSVWGVDCPFELDAALDALPQMVDDSMYRARLRNYLEYVPRDRVLVVFLEELAASPDLELARCFAFLGVDPQVAIADATRRLNTATEKFRDTVRLRHMRTDPDTAAALRRIPRRIQAKLLPALGLREPFAPGPLPWSDAACRRVVDRIGDDVREFLELCGKPLGIWPRFAEALAGRGVPSSAPSVVPEAGSR